jgi:hypothetical protein
MAYGEAIDKFGKDRISHRDKGAEFRKAVIDAPSNAEYN